MLTATLPAPPACPAVLDAGAVAAPVPLSAPAGPALVDPTAVLAGDYGHPGLVSLFPDRAGNRAAATADRVTVLAARWAALRISSRSPAARADVGSLVAARPSVDVDAGGLVALVGAVEAAVAQVLLSRSSVLAGFLPGSAAVFAGEALVSPRWGSCGRVVAVSAGPSLTLGEKLTMAARADVVHAAAVACFGDELIAVVSAGSDRFRARDRRGRDRIDPLV